jgi:hypothetical protein
MSAVRFPRPSGQLGVKEHGRCVRPCQPAMRHDAGLAQPWASRRVERGRGDAQGGGEPRGALSWAELDVVAVYTAAGSDGESGNAPHRACPAAPRQRRVTGPRSRARSRGQLLQARRAGQLGRQRHESGKCRRWRVDDRCDLRARGHVLAADSGHPGRRHQRHRVRDSARVLSTKTATSGSSSTSHIRSRSPTRPTTLPRGPVWGRPVVCGRLGPLRRAERRPDLAVRAAAHSACPHRRR